MREGLKRRDIRGTDDRRIDCNEGAAARGQTHVSHPQLDPSPRCDKNPGPDQRYPGSLPESIKI